MKWYRLYKESDEQVNLKKLLKQNGVTKLPSGTEFKPDRVSWSKDGGYAGQKTLDKICSQLEDAGWKRGEWRTGGVPDGSAVTNSNAYTSPDGQLVMTYSEHYGATAHDNFYGFTFKLAGTGMNESRRLSQRQNKEDNDIKWYRLCKESEEEEKPKFDIGDEVWYKSIQVTIIDVKPSIKQGFRYQIRETSRPNSTATPWVSGEEIFATKEECDEYLKRREEEHKKRMEDDERRWQEHLWAMATHSPADHYGVRRSYGSPNYTGD